MLISVITPSYNQGSFLAETIESVLSQEGDFEIDYIIVDGASADDSRQIIERYQNLLESGAWPVRCGGVTLRFVCEPDFGQTDALKKGFALAQGELLAWLCSDDSYLPLSLQAAVGYLEQNPGAALVYGAAQYCDAGGKIIGSYPVEEFELGGLASRNFICQPSAFFRKAAFEAVGGLDRSLTYAMDYDLFIRLGQRFDCRYLPQYFSRYRLHQDSKTVRSETLCQSHQEALQLAVKYFNWAPLNLVYGSSAYLCRARFPRLAARLPLLALGAALGVTVLRSLYLNRGIRRNDLRLLTPANLRKLGDTREEILLGSGKS
jgi:glycosyltransferase involved in cell wall biosynthesis